MDAAWEEASDVDKMIIELENGTLCEDGITFMEKLPKSPKQLTAPSTEKSSTSTTPAPLTLKISRVDSAAAALGSESGNVKKEVFDQISHDVFPQIQPTLQDSVYPSLQNLVEFRYDMLGSAHIMENVQFVGDSYANFPNSPQSPHVFSVLESVCHYYSQPCCMYISGDWVSSQIQIPVAQHICISMDDGTKRYEEVIKLDWTRISALLECSQKIIFTSVEHRVVGGNPSRRPRFRDILRRSLEETMQTLTDDNFEIIVSRATGRYGSMDYLINQLFSDPHPGCTSPYELYVGSLIQHIPQQLNIALAGARYKVCGFFQRPVLGNATILLTRGDTQLFETISINIIEHERKILGVAFDSTVAKLVASGDTSPCAIALVETASYTDFGPTSWGLNVVSHNPRVSPAFHPFCNLQQNPLFNRNLNPYYSLSFHPTPAHTPFGYFDTACPLVGTPNLLSEPLPMLTLPSTTVGLTSSIQIVEGQETPEKSQTDESSSRDERSRSVSPRRREKKPLKHTQSNGKEALAKLNPHALEYYPQGYGTYCNCFIVHSGPEEISVNELQTDSEDPVYISSVIKLTTIPAAKREELQICSSNYLEKPSTNSDISMYVNLSTFSNQSESRCSVLDPENTLEVKNNKFKMQDMSVLSFRLTEDNENYAYVDETEANHHFSESYDNGQGSRKFKDANNEWGAKNRNGYNRWSGGGRNGQANEYGQDLRVSHGFGTRRNSHNRIRYHRGSNNPRIGWGHHRGSRNNNGYAAAARTNSEELSVIPITAPQVPEHESFLCGDSKEDEVYSFAEVRRGYSRSNYQNNYKGTYRNYRRGYNCNYNNQSRYLNQYADQRNYNRRAYFNYARRNQDNRNNNNVEAEEVQQEPNSSQKWNKYPTNKFQPSNKCQDAKRGGSTRGGHQDVPSPSLTEFPSLHTVAKTAVAPVWDTKTKKPTGSSTIKKKAKCFKKYNKREGSTSSEDVDSYLGDVIPHNKAKPATIEEESDSRKDARGDRLFQTDSIVVIEKAIESLLENAEFLEDTTAENSRKETPNPSKCTFVGFGTCVDHSSLTEYDADIEGGGEPRD